MRPRECPKCQHAQTDHGIAGCRICACGVALTWFDEAVDVYADDETDTIRRSSIDIHDRR